MSPKVAAAHGSEPQAHSALRALAGLRGTEALTESVTAPKWPRRSAFQVTAHKPPLQATHAVIHPATTLDAFVGASACREALAAAIGNKPWHAMMRAMAAAGTPANADPWALQELAELLRIPPQRECRAPLR